MPRHALYDIACYAMPLRRRYAAATITTNIDESARQPL